MIAYDVEYFEALYGGSVDPFGFDRNPDEVLKFDRTLELCGAGPFKRALEIGCSEGALTWLLAPRCANLLAVDIADVAVERARQRLSGLAHVQCETQGLPAEFPDGPFDLIVASDVLYYWPIDDVVSTLPRIEDALTPGGAFLACTTCREWGS